MVAILYRMAAGIPGDVNRAQHHTVEAQLIQPSGSTGHPTAYGIPVVLDGPSHAVRAVVAGDIAGGLTGPVVYGLLVRPYPAVASQDVVGTSTPPLNGPCDVLRRGYMAVTLSGGNAAVKGGQVYIWGNTATGSHIQGGFEASSPATGNGFALSGATFMGPADANGITEISFHIA